METEELSMENVCRACLCPVDNSLESTDELAQVNFVEMLNKTFGKIVNKVWKEDKHKINY